MQIFEYPRLVTFISRGCNCGSLGVQERSHPAIGGIFSLSYCDIHMSCSVHILASLHNF